MALELAAAIIGILAAVGKVAETLGSFVSAYKGAPKAANIVLAEVNSSRVILGSLQNLLDDLGTSSPKRKQLIRLEHLVATLTDGLYLFSELEALIVELRDPNDSITKRIQWARKEGEFKTLLARLQSFKGSISAMLNILQCTGSLKDLDPTYLPTSWKSSSERLVVILESPQLQQLQSVSLSFVEDTWRSEPAPRLYRTQSQWTKPAPATYQPSGISAFESSTSLDVHCGPTPEYTPPLETAVSSALDERELLEVGMEFVCMEHRLPREDIASLFYRVEEYDRSHPEIVRDSGKVWIRVNSIGHGLTKTLKTMGSLHKKKPSFEARLGPNVPVYSRLNCYEKPGRVKRMKIVAQDCWRKFRNWSTGRDTALQTERLETTAYRMMNVSVVSLNLTPGGEAGCGARPQTGHRRLSRGPKLEGWEYMAYRGHERKDSKHSTHDEPVKRRRSDLFLDIYSTDSSVAG
ncbi:hypothetical protein E8E11_010941 [Didymella keratinophila]|nr:hypothetical protein E8E11_010941 [Didymella keratinophila]